MREDESRGIVRRQKNKIKIKLETAIRPVAGGDSVFPPPTPAIIPSQFASLDLAIAIWPGLIRKVPWCSENLTIARLDRVNFQMKAALTLHKQALTSVRRPPRQRGM